MDIQYAYANIANDDVNAAALLSYSSLLRPTRFHIIIWVYIPREQNPHQHPQAQWLQACRTVGCAIAEFKQDEATRVRCPIRGDGRITAQGEPALCMSEIANGDALLSVSFEYAGKSTQPEGEAKAALPLNGLRFPG